MQQQAFHEYNSEGDCGARVNITDLPVGEILRRARLHYGLTLQDVETALRIKASLLEALEQNRFDLLPGRVYAIGFVRSYSEYLALDGEKMVHLFKTHSIGERSKPELSFPVPASESVLPDKKILGGSLSALVIVIALLFAFGDSGTETAVPPVPTETVAESKTPQIQQTVVSKMGPFLPADTDYAAVEPAAGKQQAVDSVKPEGVIIRFTDSAWVEIRNDKGDILISRILKPGDQYKVPEDKTLVMDTGNAGALEISVNGEIVPALGSAGTVRRNVALSPESLQSRIIPQEN